MKYKLKYSSLRSEIWRWYWKVWKYRLWRIHASIAVLLCVGFMRLGTKSTDPLIWVKYFGIFLLSIMAISSAIPQLLFKSKERTLNVGQEGWNTKIGKKRGGRNWKEVASIEEDSGRVIITHKNGNALIVPEKAFATPEDRKRFLDDIKAWHASYR